MRNKILIPVIFIYLFLAGIYGQDNAIPIQAENADSLGSDFKIVTEGDVTFITPSTDFAGTTNPGTSDKVAVYKITFAAAGTYDLYVRLRVGPNHYDDDSFYFANSFGNRPPDVDSVWVRVNGIDYGATGPNEYVVGPDENTAGFEVFKWINASEMGEGAAGGTLFKVEEDSLTKTFLIGSREDGLDIDMIAFGNADLFYTVSNLENGEAGVSEIPAPNQQLIVDLSDSLRPVTHCATGALYGITQTIPSDISGLVAPLHPRMYVQPARSGAGYQQPYGAALPVSERLVSTTAEVTIRLADICPNWPYDWPGESSWISQVTSVINDKIASGRNNYYGYEIWNEHHGTWNEGTNGNFYTQLWQPTYDLIHSLDSTAKIIGPSDSYYSSSRIEEFLTFCKENDCLPDIICWHELGGSANISSNIASYRSLESRLGISPREISINEYSSSTHEYEGCPGVSAPFIAKFERNLVNSASISWWFTNLPGRLGSLLTAGNEKGGGWWFYKWYGDMSGHMVNVTPPNEYSDGIDGFACLDTTALFASICLGGNYTGMVDVQINGIPSIFGDSVEVRLQYVPWSDKDSPVSGPEMISQTTYAATSGAITVPVDITDPLYGYRVFITSSENPVAISSNQEIFPYKYTLSQNYPNPFNPETTIEYSIPTEQLVSIKVFDILGREVADLVNGKKTAGKHSVKLNAANFTSGLYFYTLKAGSFITSKKMLLVK